MSKNLKTIPTSDFDAVVATAQAYVEGLRIGDADATMRAFHADAVMFGFTNGELLGGTARNLHAFVAENGAAPDIKTRIDVLAITPTTAVVRVDMEKDAIGADYTDFHTLLKQDGGWKIVAKTYHQYEG
ncbi:nuclear transport factor 2 family protein [Sphingomonas sp. RB3P16]|uniref:nuclear transport factor 2 family protein n=1 Tax=Parasphingomonas frigoris TaxID=3096163 RepID=UPI002FC5A12B